MVSQINGTSTIKILSTEAITHVTLDIIDDADLREMKFDLDTSAKSPWEFCRTITNTNSNAAIAVND